MLAVQVGDALHKIDVAFRPPGTCAIANPQLHIEAVNREKWEPIIVRICHARRHTVAGWIGTPRRRVEVPGEGCVLHVDVAQPEVVHPSGARRKSPVPVVLIGVLGDRSQPLRGRLLRNGIRCLGSTGSVIHAVQMVAGANIVIDFKQPVVEWSDAVQTRRKIGRRGAGVVRENVLDRG